MLLAVLYKNGKNNSVIHFRGQSGYLLLELLAVIFVIMMLTSGIMLESRGLEKAYYKNQVKLAAEQLGSELRSLQQNALYAASPTTFIDVNEKEAYQLSQGAQVLRVYRFKNYGCEGVYFSGALSSTSFGSDGAPRASGSYTLSHRKNKGCRYIVELQPVTGRVLVYEQK